MGTPYLIRPTAHPWHGESSRVSPFTGVLMVALLMGCAARMVGHPPVLTSRQLEELRRSTKDKAVRLELAATNTPALQLRNVEFLPKTISGTSAEGPRSVALSDTSALVWD